MRIGLVCPYDLTIPGGVQAQVLGLAGALRSAGHHVEVLAPGRPADSGSTTTVGRALPFRVNGSVARMAPHPVAAWRTVDGLRRGDLDVVHVHEPLAPSITIPTLVARPAPLVGTFHAAGEHTPYRWVERPLRRLARRLDLRVAVSPAAAGLAVRHLGGQYEVVPNGIDLEPFAGPRPAPGELPVVLFLGRHEPRKGLGVLLASLPLLPEDVEVWIAGSRPATSRSGHEHRGAPRVRWLGPLTDEQKVGCLRRASALCVPSLHGESFGLVLLEAMAAGTPVVASDLAGYRSVTAGGTAAVLVPPGDPTALADGLTTVLHDQTLAKRLGEAGRAVASQHSMEVIATRYLELYERVVAIPATGRQARPRITPASRSSTAAQVRRTSASNRATPRSAATN